MIKPKSAPFISSNDAKQFLNPLHRKRRQIYLGGTDDATEECCNETCTYQEIADYRC